MTKQVIKTKAQTVQEIRRLRKKAEEQLFKLPNVVGSGIGLKMKSGKLTKKIGLTIFVSRKLLPGELGPGEKIPRRIIIKGRSILTDVLETRPLKPHANIFPDHPLFVSDRKGNNGVVSSFCRSPYGVFGLTCAHVIPGPDANPFTHDPVDIYSPTSNPHWIQVGYSNSAYVSHGTGNHGNYGFVDAALFTLDNPELVERAKNAKVIQTAAPELEETLQGNAASNPTITGKVSHIETKWHGSFVDVLIMEVEPGLSEGDSGMMWKNEKGKPVAIHAGGSLGINSRDSEAMLASRVAELLRVELLNAP